MNSPKMEAHTVKRKRSPSPLAPLARNPHATPLPHFHELSSSKQQRHPNHHPSVQPSTRNDDSETFPRAHHSRSQSSAYSQHPSESDRDDHDNDGALSPRQARSPYATSDLRGSPSIATDSIASPLTRPHPHVAPRPSSSSSSSSVAAAGVPARYFAQHHHGFGHAAPPYSSGLAHSSSHALTSPSSRNEELASPSAVHHYRTRSPAPYHAQAASSTTPACPTSRSPSKVPRNSVELESTHLSDLRSDLASITSPHQRASSGSTPHTPSTSSRKMDPPSSTRADAMRDSSSAEPRTAAVSAPVVKKEQSTPGEKPRGGQACLECRLAKVRCLPSSDSENCQRCQRFNFECLFVQHKRGRKPKSKLQGRDLTLLAEAAYATNSSLVQHTDRPSARKSASTPSIVSPGSSLSASALSKKAGSNTSAASPGVRWSSAPDSAFPAPPYAAEHSDRARTSDLQQDMDFDNDQARLTPPSALMFSNHKAHPALASRNDNQAALDPKNLFGVDVNRMTQAMQQAMRSLERRRGAPYTLVTNNEITSVKGNDDDINSDIGATPPAPGVAAAADTNAVNESFELIAEQPLTLRVMLKPFEVSDQPDCGTPGILRDDRNPLASQHSQTQPSQPQLDDPITQGIVSEPAARALFDIFMQHCNAWSGIFDPLLHTHDFVRKRSSFLYTVLIYVGARYSRRPAAQHLVVRERRQEFVPEADWDIAYADPLSDRTQEAADEYARQIRRRIYELAREHAARAFVDGDRTVLCCQAFFVLASWKPLDDGLSVIQVGYAFRLAMDIQLHAEMPNCVKPDESNLDQAGKQRYEAVQRRFRNRQRTFLMLFVQDKSQQISNKITTHSISADNVLIRRCQTWWRHPGSIPTDACMCASVDIRRIQGKYVELYDRIEALTSATSDGPSIMMPAFLSDLYEWSARWHEALGLREDMDEDSNSDDAAAYQRRCQRICLKLWKDNIKTYVSSLVLKSSLKQAALQEHQENVRNHHRRSTTRGTEDRDSVSGKSHLSSGLEPGTVNLMAMPAFWPCVEGARGVLEAVCAFPPERLLCSPDATIMQTTHAAVLLCSLATVKSQPPLGPGYLRSNIQLIDQASAAFRRASITEEDTVLHIAMYLESLLRPKNAAPTHAAPNRTEVRRGMDAQGRSADGSGNTIFAGTQRAAEGSAFDNASVGGVPQNSSNGQNGAAPFHGGATNTPGMGGFPQFANFTLLSNNTDIFDAGSTGTGYGNNASAGGANARWFNGGQNSGSSAPQDHSLFFNNNAGSFDREGLDAIASAAAAAAAAQNGEDGASSLEMSGVTWSSAMGGPPATASAVSAPWNSLMFGGTGGGNATSGVGEGYQPAQNHASGNMFPPTQNQSREQADETLRMLLRFLDG